MGQARRPRIDIFGGMLLVAFGLSVPSLSFGEGDTPVLGMENTTTQPSKLKETKENMSEFSPVSSGFRSAESEGQQTANRSLLQQRALTEEEPEFLETTDASGGTMINLQGKFQCGLKVSEAYIEPPVSKSMASAAR